MTLRRTTALVFSAFLPYTVHAAPPSTLGELMLFIVELLSDIIIPTLFGFALLGFIWGGAQMILHSDNEEKRSRGRFYLIWGILGIFIMVSIWGIINLLTDTLQLPTSIEGV